MRLYDTLSRSIKEFQKKPGEILSLYTCGPTVYDHTHIGHMRKYVMDDILKRTVNFLGYPVKHVMNITDVGHLTGDDDNGEDKIEKRARSLEEIIKLTKEYTNEFIEVMNRLNIILPAFSTDGSFPPSGLLINATDSIEEMIHVIQKLEKKGFTYSTNEAVYFDTSHFKDYGKLSGQKVEEKQQAVREEIHLDPGKKHPADFALWFFLQGRFANHLQHWPSPWGEGFPGWHIECSAMSMKYLGESIDIHTGGIDHIPVHHENEIAQSEAATGKKFVEYWIHYAFLQVNNEKMSKSKNNFYTLDDLEQNKIDPIALRYLFLQTHYRKPMNFTWDSARGAEKALQSLRESVIQLRSQTADSENKETSEYNHFLKKFTESLTDDLNTSQALSVVWDLLRTDMSAEDKLKLLYKFDDVFGFDLKNFKTNQENEKIPTDITELAKARMEARSSKDFHKSDELRDQIETHGYHIEDTPDGYKLKKI